MDNDDPIDNFPPAPGSVLVTGAGGGIGSATARRLSDDGYRIVAIDRYLEPAEQTVHGLSGSGHTAAEVDVCAEEEVTELVAQLTSMGHRFTGVVNCAGTLTRSPAETFTVEAWRRELDVHLTGAMVISRSVFTQLLEAKGLGSIVNIASVGSTFGLPGRLAYSTAKSGIMGMTRTLAAEWGRRGIRVNAVAPGYVATEMVKSGLRSGSLSEATLHGRTPLGRLAHPDEIASSISFLLSRDASFVNGAMLRVDGGLTIDGNFE